MPCTTAAITTTITTATHAEGTRHGTPHPPAAHRPPLLPQGQGGLRPRGGGADPRRRRRGHRRVRRHRLRRAPGGGPGGTLSGERRTPRPDPDVCRRPGRRQDPRAQPPGPRGAGGPGDRRPLGAGAGAAAAGHRGAHPGLEPAPGGDLPPVSRYRRRQARHPHPGGARHLRRPAPGGRADQRHQHRGARAADDDRRPGVSLSTRRCRCRSRCCAAPPPTPWAT